MRIRRFLKNMSGATAIEYGLMAAGIAVVVSASVATTGKNLSNALCKASKMASRTTGELFIGTAMAQELVYEDGNGNKYAIKDGSKVAVEKPQAAAEPELKKADGDDCQPPSWVS